MALVSALALAVLALAWWQLCSRQTADASFSDFNLDNWQPRTIRPLTQVELALLGKIEMAAPGCLGLPQVSLSRFLKVKTSSPYGPWFCHIGRRCVDFLISSEIEVKKRR